MKNNDLIWMISFYIGIGLIALRIQYLIIKHAIFNALKKFNEWKANKNN